MNILSSHYYMGLNEWASNFVTSKPTLVYVEEVTRVYPDGRRETLEPRPVCESSVKMEKSGEFYLGTFGGEYHLHKYTFSDGQVYFERLQATLWSSGRVGGRFHFLALQDENGNWVPESLWTKEAIEAA